MQISGSLVTHLAGRSLRFWGSRLVLPSWRSKHRANVWQRNACTSHLLYALPLVLYLLTGAHFQGIDLQPSTQHITHVWHTADPIPMGTCTGSLSTCGVAGYAMESQCHLGNIIEYDTVTNLSWSVRLTNHPIVTVIDHILSKPWPAAEDQGLEVPASKRQDDCVVRILLRDSVVTSTS
jgi:hypothetical protein